MKIGIITFHRAINYGAVLQCYALQCVLQKRGYDVQIVDYRQPHTEITYSTFSFSVFLKRIKSFRFKDVVLYILHTKKRYIKKKKFKFFWKSFLNVSDANYDSASGIKGFDYYVIGSDQLWNQFCTGGYDPVYWGNFDNSIRKMTYAISTNVPMLEQIPSDRVRHDLANFECILCREMEVAKYIRNTKSTTVTVDVAIDPTLLLSPNDWKGVFNSIPLPTCKYVLTYSVRGDNNLLVNIANKFVKEGLVVKNIDYKVSPQEFLSLIFHADCVITSSFHATVFSVIFKRPFWSIKYGDSYDARYVNLLTHLGLQKQLVTLDFMPYIPVIEYKEAQGKLDNLRHDSLNKLISNLEYD